MKDINNIEIEVGDLIEAHSVISYYTIVQKINDTGVEGNFNSVLDYNWLIKEYNPPAGGYANVHKYKIKILKKKFLVNKFIE
jgi:hypothetical protein